MALLDFISARDKPTAATPSQTQTVPDAAGKRPKEAPATPHSGDPAIAKSASSPLTSDPPPVPQANESDAPPLAVQSDSATPTGPSADTSRRWSFQGQFKLRRKSNAPRSTVEKHEAAVPTASDASTDRIKRLSAPSRGERRAKQSALVVRSLIVGQDTDEGGVASPQVPISSTQLKNVKAQLLKPKAANKVIAQLRALPSFPNSSSHASEPIQAVCLPYSDEEADAKRFSTLRNMKRPPPPTSSHAPSSSPNGSTAIDAITDTFKDLHIVNLFTAPDLGLGGPGEGEGILAGALPSAETVLNGFTEITPQLMALGYATGKTVVPNHKGIYPPTDRLSILTYWWGLEIILPPPTLAYLSRVQSISSTIMNVLTALGVMYEGVREILPFVRYFSQYINFEFNSIKAQDRGKGVICAATWIMPAALIPRPWDFPDPPSGLQLHARAAPPLDKAPATKPVATTPAQKALPALPVSQSSSSGLVPEPLTPLSPATPD